MLLKVTGINRNWLIKNNKPIIDSLDSINENGVARNVEIFDFTTLYTNLPHSDIKVAMDSVIKLAFKNSKKKYIAVYENSSRWVDKPRDGTFVFTVDELISATEFLLDNCYFTVGDSMYRQTIGVPIGIDAGPFIANLTLWYFENKFLEGTYKTKYIVTRKLRYTFRLIDDITTVNSDGYFKEYVNDIYPACLQLNKENEGTDKADVLDLCLLVKDGKFISGLYDKRDAFKFDIVQFMPMCCNQASSVLYGVFSSQLIRISRACNNFEMFEQRVTRMYDEFLKLGYDRSKLRNVYGKVVKKYDLQGKFGVNCNGRLD